MTYEAWMKADETLNTLIRIEAELSRITGDVSRLKAERAGALLEVYQVTFTKHGGATADTLNEEEVSKDG